jgi:Tfp pilus assembly protein PilO
MIQNPIPPVPPIPVDPNLFWMSQDAPKMVLMIVLAALTAAVIILWPIMRAFGRRMEQKGGVDPALKGEVEHLHQRLAELEPMQARVAELEERLDFAERLLAQGKDAERLPR